MANISGVIKSIRDIMWQDSGLNGDAQRIEQLGWMLFLKIFSDKDRELELLNDDYKSPIPPMFHWIKEKGNWAGDDEGITGDELLAFVDQKLFPAMRNIDLSVGNGRALIVREVFTGNNNYMKSGINIRKVLNKLNELDFNIAKERHAFGEIYEGILKDLQSAGKSGEFYTPRAITNFITDMVSPILGERVLDPSCGTGGYLTSAIEHLKIQANSVEDRQSIQHDVMGWEYKPLPYLLATTNLILHDIELPKIIFRDSLDRPLTSYKEKDRVDVILANPPFGGIVANNNEKNFPQNFRSKESADLFLVMMIHLMKTGGRAGIVLPDGSLTGDGVKQRVREKLLTECNLHTIIRLPNSVFQPYASIATNLLFFEKGKSTKEVWYFEHRLPEGQKSYSKTKPIRVEEFKPIKDWWDNREENEVAWKVDIKTIIKRGFDLDIKNPRNKEIEYLPYQNVLSNYNNSLNQLDSAAQNIINEFSQVKCKGDLNKLVDNLIPFMKTPNGISQMKSLIIDLAIQGKLIEQVIDDEPASILLNKIKEEKEKLISTKKLREEKPLHNIKPEEIPFKIPENWTYCRLGETSTSYKQNIIDGPFGSDLLSSEYTDNGIPIIRLQNIGINKFLDKARKYVSLEKADQLGKHNYIHGDVVICKLGDPPGKTCIIPDNEDYGIIVADIVRYRVDRRYLNNKFCAFYLNSKYAISQFEASSKGMTRLRVNLALIRGLVFPLPPLPEQKRIVEKIEQLMTLCDELEQTIQQNQKYTQELLQVALKEALEPSR